MFNILVVRVNFQCRFKMPYNGWRFEILGIMWLKTFHPLQTLPVGTELANCIETAMFYDRVLGSVIFYQQQLKYTTTFPLFLENEIFRPSSSPIK